MARQETPAERRRRTRLPDPDFMADDPDFGVSAKEEAERVEAQKVADTERGRAGAADSKKAQSEHERDEAARARRRRRQVTRGKRAAGRHGRRVGRQVAAGARSPVSGSTWTFARLFGASLGITFLYLLLTNSTGAAQALKLPARALAWLSSPTTSIPYGPGFRTGSAGGSGTKNAPGPVDLKPN